jgi:hypothetical protein
VSISLGTGVGSHLWQAIITIRVVAQSVGVCVAKTHYSSWSTFLRHVFFHSQFPCLSRYQRSEGLSLQETIRVSEYSKDIRFISRQGDNTVLAQHMHSLVSGEWIGDEIINTYAIMIMGRSSKWQRLWGSVRSSSMSPTGTGARAGNRLSVSPVLPDYCQWRVHCFSTFFWGELMEQGYQAGKLDLWTGQVCDQPFILECFCLMEPGLFRWTFLTLTSY